MSILEASFILALLSSVIIGASIVMVDIISERDCDG